MAILGIETSCDETAIAVIDSQNKKVLCEALFSQIDLHNLYGGVVPELAARDHISRLVPLIKNEFEKNDLSFEILDAIAVSKGPGLRGPLLVGNTIANSIAYALKIPVINIHHMEAHLLMPLLDANPPSLPFVSLLVSGGHTLIVKVDEGGRYIIMGETKDDALGEAFDKTAKLLNLGYPGGPEIEKLAKLSQTDRFRFPRPMINSDCLNLSFSGLKTAVLYAVQKLDALSDEDKIDISNSFQNAAVDCIVSKVLKASIQENISDLVVSGGVAANEFLRCSLADAMPSNVKLHFPDLKHCTDNGLMVAHAGLMKIENSEKNYNIEARARWSLEENNDAR
tara:strand:- start:1218 stop:2234 length:1017 start_codon:yes stop_codon:yes gene_type:complete